MKEVLDRAVSPWEALKLLCDQQTLICISRTGWPLMEEEEKSGAAAVSVARNRRLLCQQKEVPFNTALKPVG